MSRSKLPKEPLFEIRRSPIQGVGAFALRRIRKGTLIAEYTGERIGNAEADRRYDLAKMKRHHTFLFIVSQRTVVDAAVAGNDARFINHSCDPNCETYIERGRIFIEAIRHIPAGAELSYDYLYERDDDEVGKEGVEATYPCHCGAKKCRGTILAPEEIAPARKKRARKKKRVKLEKSSRARKTTHRRENRPRRAA
jgi:SET domain-containing protein